MILVCTGYEDDWKWKSLKEILFSAMLLPWNTIIDHIWFLRRFWKLLNTTRSDSCANSNLCYYAWSTNLLNGLIFIRFVQNNVFLFKIVEFLISFICKISLSVHKHVPLTFHIDWRKRCITVSSMLFHKFSSGSHPTFCFYCWFKLWRFSLKFLDSLCHFLQL